MIVGNPTTPTNRSKQTWSSPASMWTGPTFNIPRRTAHPDDQGLRGARLITNEHLEEYDGTTAVVRTRHLERRSRISPVEGRTLDESPPHACGLPHDPWFVLSHTRR